jgi:hypothetical protein
MAERRGKKLDATKHPQNKEAWMLKKRAGRPKQVWVWDIPPGATRGSGHWEKVNDTGS